MKRPCKNCLNFNSYFGGCDMLQDMKEKTRCLFYDPLDDEEDEEITVHNLSYAKSSKDDSLEGEEQ